MIYRGLAALKHRDKEEYAAGYRARFSEIPDSEAAHHCWRCGWEDADTEAIESARHKQAFAEGDGRPFLKTLGAISSTQGKRREPTAFLSMKTGRGL